MQASAEDRTAARMITSAALRAAVAWTRRDEEPQAWRELSRMTGVLMYALGPGRGPSTPLEVVELLRHPLAKILVASC
jgi:pPIWI_RE three-gene island domain Y